MRAPACPPTLHGRFGHGLWMVTRTAGDDEIVLRVHDAEGPRVGSGRTVRWSDISARAYAAVPLELAGGRIFGTLCAIDPETTLEPVAHELPAITMYARLLATILARELEAECESRRAAGAEYAALRDPLTGLPNRRAWDVALAAEENRCRRYGTPAAVLSLDIDGLKRVNDEEGHGAGDELLRHAAGVMLAGVRRHDLVARIGGDEFAILLPECSEAQTLARRADVRRQAQPRGRLTPTPPATRRARGRPGPAPRAPRWRPGPPGPVVAHPGGPRPGRRWHRGAPAPGRAPARGRGRPRRGRAGAPR